jgi:hypothetical protein
MVQLVDFFFGSREGAAACSRNPIHAPPVSTAIRKRLQQLRAFQSMKQRIERPGPDPVSMARQFLHHRQSKDGLLRRMHQNVDANKSVKKFAPLVSHTNQYTAECIAARAFLWIVPLP